MSIRKYSSALAASAALVLSASPAVLAKTNNGNDNPHNKITICHATGSQSNPYVMITPNANGVVSGHANHQDDRDIIPSFDYNDHGTTKNFPGQNWDTNGQAIWNNGCKVVAVTPPPAATTPTPGQGGGQAAAPEAPSQVVTPQGVNAGAGGGLSYGWSAAAGLFASLGSLGYGLRRFVKLGR